MALATACVKSNANKAFSLVLFDYLLIAASHTSQTHLSPLNECSCSTRLYNVASNRTVRVAVRLRLEQ